MEDFVAKNLEPETGFEPATRCLQNSCSTPELLRQPLKGYHALVLAKRSGPDRSSPLLLIRIALTSWRPSSWRVARSFVLACELSWLQQPSALSLA